MKSHSLKLVVLVFLLATSSALVVAQDQTSNVDKLTQPEAKARVQSAITSKRVKALVASAKTPEDHMRLAAYFNQEADRMEADAKGHEELAESIGRIRVRSCQREADPGSSGQLNTATLRQNRSGKRPRA